MKKILVLLMLAISMQLTFATDLSNSKTINMEVISTQLPIIAKNVNWTTVEKIEKSLPEKPITVGLDIDDTMLFSAPVFYYGQQKYSPGKFDYLKNQDFWNEASTGADKFSIPKQSAVKLVIMHLKRGDIVYFITGRTAPTKGKETLTKTIRNIFPKEYRTQIKPVVFANGLEKVKQIKEHKVTVFYGDADSDITSAKDAKIRGIRFLRGVQTTYRPIPVAGKFGEEILENSNY